MKTNRLILFTLLFVGMGITGHSQEANQENPRGAYKLIDFVGRDGSTFKPVEEQYKICTDSMTLTLNVKGDKFDFSIRKGDGIFDYTGEEPDVYDPHAPRIYDSNAQRFSFKWWSEGYLDRPLLPTKDWCIEHYEAGKFSEAGKAIIDAFMSPDYRDESNPLIGVWRNRGTVTYIQDTEEVKRVLHAPQKNTASYSVLTPSKLLNIGAGKGQIIPVRVINKDSLQMGSSMRAVTWLSPNTIAIALQQGYVVWTRALIEKPLMAKIFEPSLKNGDSYREAVKEYFVHNIWILEMLAMENSVLVENVAKICRTKTVHGLSVPFSMSKDLARTYVQTEYHSDVMNAFMRHSGLPLASVFVLNRMYNSPKFRAANSHLHQVRIRMEEEVFPPILDEVLSSGKMPAEVKGVECAMGDNSAFQDFYVKTNFEDVLMCELEMLIARMEKKNQKKLRKQMPFLTEYMKRNLPVLLQNACCGVLTGEDLQTLSSIALSPQGMAASKANTDFVRAMSVLFDKKADNKVVSDIRESIFRFVERNTYVTTKTTTIRVPVHRSSGRYY